MEVDSWDFPPGRDSYGGQPSASSICFLWYPDAQRIHERLSAPAASRRAMELFEQAERSTARVRSLRADIQGAVGPDLFTGTVTLKRPNRANIQIQGEGGLGEFHLISDGAKMHTFFPGENKFIDALPCTNGEYVTAYIADQVEHFFRPDAIKAARQHGNFVYAGTLPQNGVTYHLVDQSLGDSKKMKLRYWIAPDGLIHEVKSLEPPEKQSNGRDSSTCDSIRRWTSSSREFPVNVRDAR